MGCFDGIPVGTDVTGAAEIALTPTLKPRTVESVVSKELEPSDELRVDAKPVESVPLVFAMDVRTVNATYQEEVRSRRT